MSIIEKVHTEVINEKQTHYFTFYVDDQQRRQEKVIHTENCLYCKDRNKFLDALEESIKEKYKQRVCYIQKQSDVGEKENPDVKAEKLEGAFSTSLISESKQVKIEAEQKVAHKMAHFGKVDEWSMEGDIIANFADYMEDFGYFTAANEIDDEKIKVSFFMMYVGSEGKRIIKSLGLAGAATLKEITDGVEKYLKPKDNKRFEKQILLNMSQEGLKFDDFVKDLKQQAKKVSSDQAAIDEMVLDQIIGGVTDIKLKSKMLEKSDITYEQAVMMGRTWELDNARMKMIRNGKNIDLSLIHI